MCLNRLDSCMLHDQVIRDKVKAAKNNDSKVVLLWKKSSTCQWVRLLTVCCERFTHQPIVFLHCEANAYFIGSGCAGSLSFFFSGCCPCFLRLAASPLDVLSRTWLSEEKRESARSLFFRTFWFIHAVACVFAFCSVAMALPVVGSIGEFKTSSETFTACFET